jgi:hypothetical protein
VRINAQLIEGATGGHIWAERYDRDLTDIFAVQDEITKTIVDQLKVKPAIEQSPTENVEAYTYYLRGRQLFHTRIKSFLISARRMFARAAELDRFMPALMPAWRIAIRVSIKARGRDFGRRCPCDRQQGSGDRSQSGGSACCPRRGFDDW